MHHQLSVPLFPRNRKILSLSGNKWWWGNHNITCSECPFRNDSTVPCTLISLRGLLLLHLLPYHFHELLILNFLLTLSLFFLELTSCSNKLLDEVPVLVKKEGDSIICIHLYLLVHPKSVVDFEVETTFELLLIYFGIFGHEGLVTNLSDIYVLHEVKTH